MFNTEEVRDPKYTTDILAAEGNSLSATGEFPLLNGTQKFSAVLPSARHCPLSKTT
jgi:hypothetical protein